MLVPQRRGREGVGSSTRFSAKTNFRLPCPLRPCGLRDLRDLANQPFTAVINPLLWLAARPLQDQVSSQDTPIRNATRVSSYLHYNLLLRISNTGNSLPAGSLESAHWSLALHCYNRLIRATPDDIGQHQATYSHWEIEI